MHKENYDTTWAEKHGLEPADLRSISIHIAIAWKDYDQKDYKKTPYIF